MATAHTADQLPHAALRAGMAPHARGSRVSGGILLDMERSGEDREPLSRTYSNLPRQVRRLVPASQRTVSLIPASALLSTRLRCGGLPQLVDG
jgi:hypothetical protein